ncbi:hypothetical protein A2V82_16550 [candidate division KSB1 bacterium RBG_16_48_16]|nr:MAG: hypothetical protein A2V82_16550 [candidate division KSB1 bacterium RBG_16_48_16]
MTVANTTVQGLAMGVALVHDGFAATGNILYEIRAVINSALVAPFLLVNEAVISILEGLDSIPGLDLSGPIDTLRASSMAMMNFVTDEVANANPFSYWSDNVANSIAVVDEAINRLGESGGETSAVITAGGEKVVNALGQQAEATKKVTEATKEGVEGLKSFVEITADGTVVFNDNYTALEKVASATDTKGTADKKAAAELKKNVDAMIEFKLGLEEIQSKERVSIFEIQAKGDIASLEATSQAFETMFTSLDSGIASTGETLLGLFGMMGQASSTPFGMEVLLAAIEQEQELRQGEFDLQKKLIEAQIKYMALKATALKRNDALINISADGLEPEIEAFMWQILKRIQIRANAEGAEYLLGI